MSDFYTRKLLIDALKQSGNAMVNVMPTLPTQQTDQPSMMDNINNNHYGLNLDVNNKYAAIGHNGNWGDGQYQAQIAKPYNGQASVNLNYTLPNKDGALRLNGNISPNDRSFSINYGKQF
jgi:hypothetical protein